MFMHSIEYKYAPSWIKNEQRAVTQTLRDEDKYHLPQARTEAFKKIPIYSLPEEWNKHNDMRYQNNKTLSCCLLPMIAYAYAYVCEYHLEF